MNENDRLMTNSCPNSVHMKLIMPHSISTTNSEEKAHGISLSSATCACGTEAVTNTTDKQNFESSFCGELNQSTGS